MHCHMILEFKSRDMSHLFQRNSSLKLENLWTIKIWCSSLENVEANGNHRSGSYRYLALADEQGNDGKKTRYNAKIACYREYETDGSMKFITAKDLEELWYLMTKSKEQYVRNWNLKKRYKSIYKVRTGDFWWVRSEGFLRERF